MLELRKIPRLSTERVKGSYEQIYTTQEIRHRASFYRWILGILGKCPDGRFLDVACGVGVLSNFAARQGIDAYGVDFSEVATTRAGHEGAAKFSAGNGESLPFADRSFHYATCIGSLEHYLSPLRGAEEICRILVPGGTAIFFLPNTFSILHNVWTSFRTGRTGQDNQPLERFAARYEWQDLLEEAGFEIVRTLKYEQEIPTEWSDVVWYLHHWKRLVRLVLMPLVPLNWTHSFVYVCRRVKS